MIIHTQIGFKGQCHTDMFNLGYNTITERGVTCNLLIRKGQLTQIRDHAPVEPQAPAQIEEKNGCWLDEIH